MGKSIFQKISVALVALLVFLSGVQADTNNDAIDQFAKRVSTFQLKNGLRVIVVERPIAPIISFATYIRTGGVDDENGRSGLAHMFEHMLFKGTQKIGTKNYAKEAKLLQKIDEANATLQLALNSSVASSTDSLKNLQDNIDALNKEHETLLVPEEFWQIYESAGGQGLNAATGYDFTNYVISLPKNQLPLWMEMESARLKTPVLREFYKERSVVLEERRMRVDTSATGKLWETFLATAYLAHPYGRPILGWESEISRVTRQDAADFFGRHYDVSRLVVAIVGDVKKENIEKMMTQYFGSIKSKGAYVPSRYATEPVQEGERRVTVVFDAEPSFIMGYHRPNMMNADEAALSVTSDILSGGNTSRLVKEIVEKKRLASSIWSSSSAPGEREPSLFVIGGTPLYPHTSSEVEKAIEDEIIKLAEIGPSSAELEKVKNNTLSSVLHTIDSNGGIANQLAYYESVGGSWQQLIKLIRSIQAVSAEDVKRVAQTYLITSNKTVGTIVKKENSK